MKDSNAFLFPTCVGVILLARVPDLACNPVPHECGGDPFSAIQGVAVVPHVRGGGPYTCRGRFFLFSA